MAGEPDVASTHAATTRRFHPPSWQSAAVVGSAQRGRLPSRGGAVTTAMVTGVREGLEGGGGEGNEPQCRQNVRRCVG